MFNVGLVGWGASTGNGGMNHDLARLAPWITSWLCPKHPSLGWHEPYLEAVADTVNVVRCNRDDDIEIYNRFLDSVDAVLFIEQVYLNLDNYDLVAECKKRGVFTVCIPMWEWWPERKPWSQSVDMVWCVTKYTRQYLTTLAKYLQYRHDRCDWANAIYGQHWGIELEEFQFTPRKRAKRFLFANGQGGGKPLRKGSTVIAEAAAYIPEIEIIMLSQTDNYAKPMPDNVKIVQRNFPTKTEIYQNGDVFLVPTHWEGLGHGLYEAQACGLPVITTNAPPMDECGADWFVPVVHSEQYKLSGKPIPKVFADAKELARLLRKIQNMDILDKSIAARKRVEDSHDLKAVVGDLGRAIETAMVGNRAIASITGVDNLSRIRYQAAIKKAWNAFEHKQPEQMNQFLLASLSHSPYLKTETILDWFEQFNNFSANKKPLKHTQAITSSESWERLIEEVLLK